MNQGYQQVYQRSTELSHGPDMLACSVKHPDKVMIWSIILTKVPGRIHVVEGSMNTFQYSHVIDTRVTPQLHDWYGDVLQCIFQHDKLPWPSGYELQLSLKRLQVLILVKVIGG